ncbi:hypothetical protein C7449_10423 [Mycoplana dimorpha]|uniref:Uncharacterized protein n=1 Tax=Mycoplana dimorpha TaxID=28320 RepID=A0A2T5B7J7_MYCDI|nr:hypothetical protein C7449_10423 [Mycoplana dimorpha]
MGIPDGKCLMPVFPKYATVMAEAALGIKVGRATCFSGRYPPQWFGRPGA